MAADPRSPSLDAAVEELRQAAIHDGVTDRVGAAIAHMEVLMWLRSTATPSGEGQEPSQAAVEAAHWKLDGQLADVNEDTHQMEPSPRDEEEVVREMLRAAYAVDRPREPSPELRERVAKAIERAYNEFDLSAFSKLDDRFWPEAADAVLAALREEQGR